MANKPAAKQKLPKGQKLGRPVTRTIKLDATPEQVAQRIFENAKPPDPSLRRTRKKPK